MMTFEKSALVLLARIIDHDLEKKAVKLRLWQGVGAFLLYGILGRKHREMGAELALLAVYGCRTLLHRFQQCRLCLCGGAVDFISEQKIGKEGPRTEAQLPGARVEDRGTDDVARHQVGSELQATEADPKARRDAPDQERLGHARHTLDQAMTSTKECNKHEAHRCILTDHVPPNSGEEALIQPRHFGRRSGHRVGHSRTFRTMRSICS